MADYKRLVELSMVPPLAKELAPQIDSASGSTAMADVDPIADPSTATAPQIAAKVNEIIDALKG